MMSCSCLFTGQVSTSQSKICLVILPNLLVRTGKCDYWDKIVQVNPRRPTFCIHNSNFQYEHETNSVPKSMDYEPQIEDLALKCVLQILVGA
jgi:hypothetical protein